MKDKYSLAKRGLVYLTAFTLGPGFYACSIKSKEEIEGKERKKVSSIVKKDSLEKKVELKVVPDSTDFEPYFVEHMIMEGQNLTGISKIYGVTVEEIKNDNGIKDANKIKVGDKLKVYPNY